MSRPFSLTMQAHQLDLYRLWIALLLIFTLLTVAWGVWAATARVVSYEHSIDVRATERTSQSRTMEQEENVYRTRTRHQRWFEAHFPRTALGKIEPGQSATLFISSGSAERQVEAQVSEVFDDGTQAPLRVLLQAGGWEEDADLLLRGVPKRARVAIETVSPLSLLIKK